MEILSQYVLFLDFLCQFSHFLLTFRAWQPLGRWGTHSPYALCSHPSENTGCRDSTPLRRSVRVQQPLWVLQADVAVDGIQQKQVIGHITHTIHVWYISLHESHKNQPNVGKYSSIPYMDPMG